MDFILRVMGTTESFSSTARISSVLKRMDWKTIQWREEHPLEGYYITLVLMKDDAGVD